MHPGLPPPAGPKRADLAADGRFVLHAFLGDHDEEFQVSGQASAVHPPAERAAVHAAIRFPVYDADDPVFALHIARCHRAIRDAPAERPTRRESWRAC